MAIAAADIDFFLSGGAANADVNASLGGAISSVQIVDATLHNLFDQVSSAEALAGDTEYRCIYVKNNVGGSPSQTLQSAKVWIQTNTPSADTTIAIGLGSQGVNGQAPAIANESTAPPTGSPDGVTFSTPTDEGTSLSIGDLAQGAYQAIWIRRTINSAAAAYNGDGATLRVKGDTAA